jgi:hypothetical protein
MVKNEGGVRLPPSKALVPTLLYTIIVEFSRAHARPPQTEEEYYSAKPPPYTITCSGGDVYDMHGKETIGLSINITYTASLLVS